MDLNLSGKTALVTGSSEGIGKSIAVQLARQGAAVFMNGRTSGRLEEAADDVRRIVPGSVINTVLGDVGNRAGVDQIVKGVGGSVDILCNNVGPYHRGDFFEIDDETWLERFETTVMSGVRLSRALMPSMLTRNWGRIIFTSSCCATEVIPELMVISVNDCSKCVLARGLAERAKGTGVTVNSVLPGVVNTPGMQKFCEERAEQEKVSVEEFKKMLLEKDFPQQSLGRMIEPDEVANLVGYLASRAASATTGAAMRVDGSFMKAI